MHSSTGLSERPSWAIVGQGAIGLLAACQAQLHQWPVALWLRQPRSLQIDFQQLNHQHSQHLFSSWPADTTIRHIFIAVKAFDVEPCLQQLLPRLSHDAHIALSHNGMGTIEPALALLLPTQQLWFVSTTHGAYKPASDQLIHSGAGRSIMAPVSGSYQSKKGTRPNKVSKFLADALGPLTEVEDIEPYLWQKLAINCLINPLTALYHVKNGDLARAQYQPQLRQLLYEVCLVAQAEGIALEEDSCWQQVQQVIINTADNLSSMLQDRRAGRRTELEFITGYLLRQAKKHQFELPAQRQLYQDCQDAGF